MSDDIWCPECGYLRLRCTCVALDLDSAVLAEALDTLAQNLAVAGALQRMFDLGWDGRMESSYHGRDAWKPNTTGRPAP